jgi:hypothetical protein
MIHREARTLRKLTGEIVQWLQPMTVTPHQAKTLARWPEAIWRQVQGVVHVQGVAAYLQWTLPGSALEQHLPASFRTWLAQTALNRTRVAILQDELAAILAAAHQAGVSVMPLKGALLSTHYYAEPELRPLGDLDLLIRPEGLAAMVSVLQRLGYQAPVKRSIAERRYQNHFLFVNTKTPTVVSYSGEHPDNPRSVELHTGLRRGLWGKFGAYDITELMWRESTQGQLLGEPAILPTPGALLCHVAIHALRHFLGGDGRAIQWVDLALLANQVPALDAQLVQWIYPILRLASRGLPGSFAEPQLTALEPLIHPYLRRWAATVPLDTRCGLVMRFSDHEQFLQSRWGQLQRHVSYWWPSPLRMALFGDDLSRGQAYRQFFSAYGQHWRTWLRAIYQERRGGTAHQTHTPIR